MVLFISLVTLSKIVLGSVVGLVGAFIPIGFKENPTGSTDLIAKDFKLSISGSIRVGVVLIGVLIVGTGILDAVNDYKDREAARDQLAQLNAVRRQAYHDWLRDCLKGQRQGEPDKCWDLMTSELGTSPRP